MHRMQLFFSVQQQTQKKKTIYKNQVCFLKLNRYFSQQFEQTVFSESLFASNCMKVLYLNDDLRGKKAIQSTISLPEGIIGFLVQS